MKKYRKVILTNSGQEAHIIGPYTAVCWNVKQVEKKLKGPDGLIYKTQVWERQDKDPYICFLSVREYEKGEFCRSENSPVEGGLSLKGAQDVAIELQKAIEYLKTVRQKP